MPASGPRVIVNDRVLWGPRTGIGHYVAELISGLREADPGVELLPFYQMYLARLLRRPGERRPSRPCARPPSWLRPTVEKLYQAAFARVGRLCGCQLYHEPCNIPGPWDGLILTTIHDLSVIRYPQWHPADRVQWYQSQFEAALARSEHFVAVSEFTKREMVELLAISPERITVIHAGPRPAFRPRPPDQVRTWLAARGLPAQYLLYVGTLEPRKNLDGILAAYSRLPSSIREGCPLLLAGSAGWQHEAIDRLVRGHGLQAQVRALGYQDDQALAMLYAGARALVWPSFYEGFGLPPLEAMATGTPVISANSSSIPEVVASAGILVDPHDVGQISAAIRAVLEDRVLAEALSQRGLRRSREFSRLRFAAEHAALYRRLVGQR